MTNIDLQEAIKTAMQTEKDAMDYYRLAAEKMADERCSKTFKSLARDEAQHARSFFNVYSGGDIPSFDDFINGPVNENSSWFNSLRQSLLGDFDERKALELAIEQEEALEKELRAMAEKIDNPIIKEVYLANAHSTHHHMLDIEEDYKDLFGMS
jgi:rubrerythrin